jgi:hypothetical protein
MSGGHGIEFLRAVENDLGHRVVDGKRDFVGHDNFLANLVARMERSEIWSRRATRVGHGLI